MRPRHPYCLQSRCIVRQGRRGCRGRVRVKPAGCKSGLPQLWLPWEPLIGFNRFILLTEDRYTSRESMYTDTDETRVVWSGWSRLTDNRFRWRGRGFLRKNLIGWRCRGIRNTVYELNVF